MGRKRNVKGAATLEDSMEGPQKIKNRTIIWSSNSTTWYLYEGNINSNSKWNLYPRIHCSIIYNSQDLETPVFIDG